MDMITRSDRTLSTAVAHVDPAARYALAADVPIIVRAPDEVQIGAEEPRRALLLNAPPEAAAVLAGLDGSVPVGVVLAAHDADPLVWHDLLAELLRADLLVPVGPDSAGRGSGAGVGAGADFGAGAGSLAPERLGLVHRHGPAAAGRILQARRDALVVVRGDSVAAGLVATLLAAAGVGHVHHDPARGALALRPRSTSAAAAAAAIRAANPWVRTHRPAPHHSPAVIVLAEDCVPDLGVAATLVQQRLPHLSVLTLAGRAIVGPLVLPGRSSCLGCLHRHRVDADPAWPVVARTLARQAPRSPVTVAAMAAAFAAGQVLDLLDGQQVPATVNGSIEWTAAGLSAGRRNRPVHPDCGCR